MHPHAELIKKKLYTALSVSPIDHAAMAACYHHDATFSDIAFTLPDKGVLSWLVPSKRREKAMGTLKAFIEAEKKTS